MSIRHQYGRLRFNFQSSQTRDLKISNLSTQFETEIDGTWGLSSKSGYTQNLVTHIGPINALGLPTQDPH